MPKAVGIDLGTTNSVVDAALKDKLAGSDIDAIRAATERLMSASQTMAQQLYEQASATSASGPASGSDDEMVDAEIVDAEIVDAEIVDAEIVDGGDPA